MTSQHYKTTPTPLSTISSRREELPPRSRNRSGYCRTRFLGIPIYFLWIILLLAILALVLPLSIMLSRRHRKVPKSTVLVPLYVYPSSGAWDPLFTAVKENPKVKFTIIVNPNSGPGDKPLDGNYTTAIPLLNSFPNVRSIGYVSTNYTNRDLSLVFGDIDTYSSWLTNSTTGMGMKGIFLDETPNEWSDEAGKFYDTVAIHIRNSTGFGSNPLIIHNPGTIPDPQFLTSSSSNISVVFEGSYASYNQDTTSSSISAFQKSSKVGRERMAAIVYDFPDGQKTKDFVRQLRKVVGSLFLTGSGVDGDVYAGWWEAWQSWVGEM